MLQRWTLIAFTLTLLGVGAFWWFTQVSTEGPSSTDASFARIMSSGKILYERGEPSQAVEIFQRGLALNPANPDAHLNLANAYLLAGQPIPAALEANEALRYEPGNAAANYLLGCAFLRQNQFSNAVQALSEAKAADPAENPVSFQLGRAYLGWGRMEEATEQFREVLQFDTNHPAASYLLSQSLLRLGRRPEAQVALAEHQRISGGKSERADNPALYESCKYTTIRAPFSLEQPESKGVSVRFAEVTSTAFNGSAASLRGPITLLDINRRGANDLLLLSPEGARIYFNSNGVFAPSPLAVPVTGSASVSQVLIGDLQNDRFEDALLLSPEGLTLFRFATNGAFFDASNFSGLRREKATGRVGALVDLDFTGKLGLLVAGIDGRLRSFTNIGSGTFRESRVPQGILDPFDVGNVAHITIDDLNNDDLPDVLLTRSNLPPYLLLNRRGGGLSASNQPPDWPVARALTTGDFNNDLRTDVALVTGDGIELRFGGLKDPRRLDAHGHQIEQVRALDYDNDGWLDIVAWGSTGLHLWRNQGTRGFLNTTTALGLASFQTKHILHLAAADFDGDCDIDWIIDVAGEGLKFLRNDGANANGLLKLRLFGNRSNASGLGVKVELASSGWRALRMVQQLPVEIGIGKRAQLDLVSTRWFDTKLDTTGIVPDCKQALTVFELVMPTGSCPYLYAWDGSRFRFITDLLGAAPIGLPVTLGHCIEADPDEWVRIGDEQTFLPRAGLYEVRLTEELREILYLDTAQLRAIDHPLGTELFATSKLVPSRPFPKASLIQLGGRRPLLAASLAASTTAATNDSTDVTRSLAEIDEVRVSPLRLRNSHYRGLAEPFSLILDFGPLPNNGPLILALTGWLRFGGGMANIAASHQPEFPFPFPTLEAENSSGWHPVAVTVGAPAGKTKGIVVDLTGHLPLGTRRLRLTQAFELHWDRIALFTESTTVEGQELKRVASHLHWRGYSAFEPRPWTDPLTPDYTQTKTVPPWHITPSGWATRYGPVDALLNASDNGLVVIAGGDELSLKYDGSELSTKAPGTNRDFFLFTTGWDKDADYHVISGTTIDPLPWRTMDDQQIGVEPRPLFPSDTLHHEYNTRWVGERTFSRKR